MFQDSINLIKSFFIYPGLSLNYLLIGILLALAFAAVWLCAHWPPLFKNPRLWLVWVGSALLTVLAIAFIQQPLQTQVWNGFYKLWSEQTLMTWLLLIGLPQMILSGLVQEAAKMVPILVWWWRCGKNISPRMGLAIGAIAGAGFGVFEALWVHNRMFAAGWTTLAFQTDGFMAIAGFWERFFAVGFHIAVSALVGYGLAKGKGWQFYLIAVGLHSLINYGTIVYMKGYFSAVQMETFVAVVAVAVSVWALLLRWGRTEEVEMETAGPTDTGEPPQ